ncbi:hypothetical protein TcCL_Unassigned03359 [Trypanosoma cruzi]|nr:hypothetical protein TcCL_Unassigned03359 [Trypanosoma cruzi]
MSRGANTHTRAFITALCVVSSLSFLSPLAIMATLRAGERTCFTMAAGVRGHQIYSKEHGEKQIKKQMQFPPSALLPASQQGNVMEKTKPRGNRALHFVCVSHGVAGASLTVCAWRQHGKEMPDIAALDGPCRHAGSYKLGAAPALVCERPAQRRQHTPQQPSTIRRPLVGAHTRQNNGDEPAPCRPHPTSHAILREKRKKEGRGVCPATQSHKRRGRETCHHRHGQKSTNFISQK